jgi:hypothetical protein
MSAGRLPPSGALDLAMAVVSYKIITYPLKLTAMGPGGIAVSLSIQVF